MTNSNKCVLAHKLPLPILVATRGASDDRGSFLEAMKRSTLPPGVPEFVQTNVSRSEPGVLRGLHYHRHQWDLWTCAEGVLNCVLVDLRPSALAQIATVPTSGVDRHVAQVLRYGESMLIPPGVAHGFYVPGYTEGATLVYSVTREYDSADEFTLRWNQVLREAWGMHLEHNVNVPKLSERDRNGEMLGLALERVASWGLDS